MGETRGHVAIAVALTALLPACTARRPLADVAGETAKVDSVIRSNIRWALNKDTTRLYGTLAHDTALFWFSPDSGGTIAVRSDFRDMRIHLSHGGDVAWWSCIVDRSR